MSRRFKTVALAVLLGVSIGAALSRIFPTPAQDQVKCHGCNRWFTISEQPEAFQDSHLRWFCCPECEEDYTLAHVGAI